MKLDVQAAAARTEKAALERQLEEVQLSCAAGQADVAALKRDLASLDAKAGTPGPALYYELVADCSVHVVIYFFTVVQSSRVCLPKQHARNCTLN